MTFDEKFTLVIDSIYSAHQLTPLGFNAKIRLTQDHPLRQIHRHELWDIFGQLELKELIKVKDFPGDKDLIPEMFANDPFVQKMFDDNTDTIYLDIFDAFDEWYRVEYQGNKQKFANPNDFNNKVLYRANYSEMTRRITINDIQISRPDGFSENELIFAFLYDHPNQSFSLSDLEEHTGEINKSLHKVVENLGFRGDLKTVFFKVASDRILFRNPIRESQLKEVGIKKLNLKAK